MLKKSLLYLTHILLLAALVNASLITHLYAQAAPNVSRYTFVGVADWDNDGRQDILTRDSNGLLWLYPGDISRGASKSQRVQIGNGWSGYTFAGLADWDNDGHQDIVARDSTGLLWLYPGDSSRDYSRFQRVQIGNGWRGYTFAGLVDWDNDGYQDIVTRDSSGLLWLYPGDGSHGYSKFQRVQTGNGWRGYTFAGLADWDNDGYQDIVTRDAAGLLWLYPGDGSQGYSSYQPVQIGGNW